MTKSPYKLQLTNGFFADFVQISRLLDFSVKNKDQGRIPIDAYANGIGMANRRTKNLCGIAGAFELIRPVVLTPTEMGLIIYTHDPYLEMIGTLWLLHFIVASNSRHVVWNRLINWVIPENEQFSTTTARPYFHDLGDHFSQRSVEKNLPNEMAVVWNAYTEQAFRYLGFIQSESDLIYSRGNQESIPSLIFCACLLKFRETYYPEAVTLSISQITDSENSPGRVLGLSKRQVRDLLEEVKLSGFIFVESRADLDQVRFRDEINFLDVVGRYYEER